MRVESGEGWRLFLGDYREAFPDCFECDAVITDPPYGKRTHAGHDRGVTGSKTGSDHLDGSERRLLSYSSWAPSDVETFAEFWHEKTRGWIAAMSCDELARDYRSCLEHRGRLGFAPLPCVIPGMTVRLMGDGPSSWSVSLNVARPRREPYSKWGTLPGYYKANREHGHIGGKPLAMMRAIVRDYTKRGELVCDPCAGAGTTLLAAVLEGRQAVGAEIDPVTFGRAVARLRKGYTPTFDFGGNEE